MILILLPNDKQELFPCFPGYVLGNTHSGEILIDVAHTKKKVLWYEKLEKY